MRLKVVVTALLSAALPLSAGVIFSMDPKLAAPLNTGTYAGGTVLNISVTGTVNLNGPDGIVITNPDGSLQQFPSALCDVCWSPGYQYFLSGNATYPTFAGGDGTNHFTGGGGNYDLFPGNHSAWAPEGKQTTDTMDPRALRLGSLAYTFTVNPTATDWFLVGFGGTFVAPQGGGTLMMVVVDTFYSNNTGSYNVAITPLDTTVPEPSAIWLALSGAAILGLPRAFRRLSRKA